MGVTYKLKDEIVDFIIQEKHKDPRISCRALVDVIEQTFHIHVSKSSINAVIKNAALSNPVGRTAKKTKFKLPKEKTAEILKPAPLPTAPESPSVLEHPTQVKEKFSIEEALAKLEKLEALPKPPQGPFKAPAPEQSAESLPAQAIPVTGAIFMHIYLWENFPKPFLYEYLLSKGWLMEDIMAAEIYLVTNVPAEDALAIKIKAVKEDAETIYHLNLEASTLTHKAKGLKIGWGLEEYFVHPYGADNVQSRMGFSVGEYANLLRNTLQAINNVQTVCIADPLNKLSGAIFLAGTAKGIQIVSGQEVVVDHPVLPFTKHFILIQTVDTKEVVLPKLDGLRRLQIEKGDQQFSLTTNLPPSIRDMEVLRIGHKYILELSPTVEVIDTLSVEEQFDYGLIRNEIMKACSRTYFGTESSSLFEDIFQISAEILAEQDFETISFSITPAHPHYDTLLRAAQIINSRLIFNRNNKRIFIRLNK